MGFLEPSPPPFDLDEWRSKPYLERLKANAQDWAVNGFGTPTFVYWLYVVKLIVFAVGAFLVIGATTPGLGGLGDFGDWWTEPIVFQKLAVWTAALGDPRARLGLDAARLSLRAPDRGLPLLAATGDRAAAAVARQGAADRGVAADDPRRRPLRRGDRGGPLPAALRRRAGRRARRRAARPDRDRGPARRSGACSACATRSPSSPGARRSTASCSLVSLFPLENLIVGWQLVFICIWWGAAASKLNHHFPYVIAVMVSNTPWNRSRSMKAKLYRDYPEDLRPSRYAKLGAHLGTAVEFGLPLLLLVTAGGTIGTIAVIGMLLFHVHITSTFALGVPLEWNLFMIFGLLFLFGHYGDVPLSTLDDPLLLVADRRWSGSAIPVIGNLCPEKVSFLPSMRYYAGNWATSTWMFRKATEAEERLDRERAEGRGDAGRAGCRASTTARRPST